MEQLDNNDRLSMLPDDVVLSVLERLDNTKSAIRTGVLSKRWEHLPWLLAELNIDVTASKHEKSDMEREMMELDMLVDNFLVTSSTSNEKARTIKKLRMVFYLMDNYTSNIFFMLGHAIMEGRVKLLELELKVNADADDEDENEPNEPSKIHTRYLMSSGDSVLSSIEKLVLHDLRFRKSKLNLLLQKCKRLVTLEMINCDCGEGVPWKIDAPESQIEHLVFEECEFGRIEIYQLPKLRELNFFVWSEIPVPLYLGSVPSLKRLVLSNCISVGMAGVELSEIGLVNAPNLVDLALGFGEERIWVEEEPVKRLRCSLATLNSLTLFGVFVGCDLSWSMLLLEAAPILKIFVITLYENTREGVDEYFGEKPNSILWNISSFKHHHLEKLIILGIQNEGEEDELPIWGFVKLVMVQAVSLVHVVLSERDNMEICENDVVKAVRHEVFDEDGKKRTIKVDRIRTTRSPH